MRITKNIFRTITAISLSLVVLTFISLSVSAQASDNSAQGAQISPAVVELNAAKGKSYEVDLKVTNVTASDLKYKMTVSDFTSSGETGSPKIEDNSNLPDTASIKTWISGLSDFTLPSRTQQLVKLFVNVPSNAEAGGHYGVVRFSGTAPNIDTTGVGVSASTGVLFLIRVDGNITEKASLASFYTSKTQQGGQSPLFENSPISFVVRIKNEGNIHVKPVGNIEVRDMFGGLVTNMSVNDNKSNVLPDSIRRFDEAKLNKDWMIGRYTADLTMGYGTKGQAITNTISFWVIPYKIILAVLLVLATVIFIIRRLIKVYNRRIIEKAKNENNKHTKRKS